MLFSKKGGTDTIYTVGLPTYHTLILYRLVRDEADKNKASFTQKQKEILNALTQRAYDDIEAERRIIETTDYTYITHDRSYEMNAPRIFIVHNKKNTYSD